MPHNPLQPAVRALKRLITPGLCRLLANSRLWHFLKTLDPSGFLRRILYAAFAPNCERFISKPPEVHFRNPPDLISFHELHILASRLPIQPILPLSSQDISSQMAASSTAARLAEDEPEYEPVELVVRGESQSPQLMSQSRAMIHGNGIRCRPELSKVVDNLVAVNPEEHQRYERNIKVCVTIYFHHFAPGLMSEHSR